MRKYKYGHKDKKHQKLLMVDSTIIFASDQLYVSY
jgi:hypothetical protein